MTEAARVREVWRYFPTAIQTALNVFESQPVPDFSFSPQGQASSLVDGSLTCFAQLCALRLNASNVYISLLDQYQQYVLAEATTVSSLRNHGKDVENADRGLWLSAACLPRGRLASTLLWDTARLHDPTVDHLIINDLMDLEAYRDRTLFKEENPKRGYAAVPLRTRRGVTIGLLCAYFQDPITAQTGTVNISLMKDIGLSVVENLDLRRAQEDSQRVEDMTRGLIRFIDASASPNATQDFAAPSPAPQDRKVASPLSREPSSYHNPGSHDRSGQPDENKTGPAMRSLHTPLSSPSLSDSKQVDPFNDIANSRKVSRNDEAQQTAQARTTATMQGLLPMQGKAMFTRAAEIIRETSKLDGVVLFDASIAALNQPRVPQAMTSDERTFGRSTADIPETHRSAKSFNFKEDESITTNTSGSQNSESKVRQTCRVLGFSGGDLPEQMMQNCLSLPEIALRRMLRQYPEGKIINYDADGTPSEDSDSSQDHRAPPPSTLMTRRHEKHLMTLRAIHAVASGATSLAFVPLWDYQRSRYFACCLCWTTRIGRILSPRLDLIYYRAFGNSIMMELSRLDARTSDTAKTTFVASISHELRSPLHGIMGAAEFLVDTDLDSFQVNMLHTITTSSKTLLDTLNHVMDYSKMNQHFDGRPRSTLELKDVDHIRLTAIRRMRGSNNFAFLNDVTTAVDFPSLAEEVVEAVYASQSYRLATAGVEDNTMSQIKNSVQRRTSMIFSDAVSQSGMSKCKVLNSDEDLGIPPLPDSSIFEAEAGRKVVRLIFDASQHDNWSFALASGVARRLIMNILGNALKFTSSGYVKVALSANDNVPGLNARDTQVTLTVSDTGRGMSSDFLINRLFSAFQQEDSFSSGIGLGMHIVRQLIETVGGRIDIKSRPHKGTEVVVKLNLPSVPTLKSLDVDSVPARDQLVGKKVFILDVTSAVLDSPPPEGEQSDISIKRTAAKLVTDSLARTLRTWLKNEVTCGEVWENQDVDIVICTEASFYHLREITKKVDGRKLLPLIIIIAVDALEAAALRNDVRVQSEEFVCGICVQPLGPRKLIEIFTQCWQRREERLQLANSTASSSPVSLDAPRPFETANMVPIRPGMARARSRQSVPQIQKEDMPFSPSTKSPSTTAAPIPLSSVDQSLSEAGQVILITDDNAINRRLLIAFMKRHKIPHVEAVNGLNALNLYKATPTRFHVILMDLSMPVMDGMTATRRIRSFERETGLPKVPIIALTGLTSEATRKEAFDSGFDNYLTKPVDFGNLLGWIKTRTGKMSDLGSAQGTPKAGTLVAEAQPLE